MNVPPSLHRDLVLVGGGHAHALAIRMLAMRPIEGLRVTLVSDQTQTPYSGMLPGLVAGHYDFEKTHIDLDRLCQWAQVRFIRARVVGLVPVSRTLKLESRPDLQYDVVSLDIGSQPELDSVPGAREFAIPVKPVSTFWQRWQTFARELPSDRNTAISLVGGGAGSVELALSMARVLSGKAVSITLWSASGEILPHYNTGARRKVERALERFGIAVQTGSRVASVSSGAVTLEDGRTAPFDALFWCTAAAPAPWIAQSGLPVDDSGFLAITDALHSTADAQVFGAGDIATQLNHPRPKAGVFAVRQAPALVHNLRATLLGKPLKSFVPQRRFLSLISLGDKNAVAEKGGFSASGGWVWRWKDWIDRRFMQRFEQLPTMKAGRHWGVLPEARDRDPNPPCGGCGAKLCADTLASVLRSLSDRYPALTPASAEDAAPVPTTPGKPVLQSVDILRSLVPDPFVMGRIAALHALSDLYACAAQPVSALATVTLPFSAERIAQRDLLQLLAGALEELSAISCTLTGGHTLQGPELSVGFVVNGQADGGGLKKTTGKPQDALILTKPLGTGVIFAARMQGRASPAEVDAAIESMLVSNREAAAIAVAHDATACTDITGFGLAGHLQEMLGEALNAQVNAAHLPVLPGTLDHLRAGISSTMHSANMRSAETHTLMEAAFDGPRHDLLFDPQTSGGLLIACPPDRADSLQRALHKAGYGAAAIIGCLSARENTSPNRIAVSHG